MQAAGRVLRRPRHLGGRVDALSRVLAPLPADFPAAVLVVLHLPHGHASRLPEILGRKTVLHVREARSGELLTPGSVYVAPPGRHLEACADGTTRLTDAPKEHHSLPSGNPLFFSLAKHYGERAVAVVLCGYDGGGAEGLLAVKPAGGATMVQDEATSAQFSMPRTAIETGAVDQVLDVDGIAAALLRLVGARG